MIIEENILIIDYLLNFNEKFYQYLINFNENVEIIFLLLFDYDETERYEILHTHDEMGKKFDRFQRICTYACGNSMRFYAFFEVRIKSFACVREVIS